MPHSTIGWESLGAILGAAAWYQIDASCPETQNRKVPVLVRCDRITEEEHEGKKSRRMQFTITIPDEHVRPHTCRLLADRVARKLAKGPLTLQHEEAHRSVKRGDTSAGQRANTIVEGLENAKAERSRLA